MPTSEKSPTLTFWQHLDQLRGTLLRILAVVVLFAIVAFIFKEQLFAVIFAPRYDTFVTYRLLGLIGGSSNFSIELINTDLARQFVIHMKAAMYGGLIVASPYIIYELFAFVAPALHTSEKHYARLVAGSGYVMFVLGVLLNYYLIFPLTFRFLGTYQVSANVTNLISLESYMDTLIMMTLMLGLVFELPVLAWLLAKTGVLKSSFMVHYRRYAIVAIVAIAAIITPTTDAFTMMVVALPIYLLYEASIAIVKRTEQVVAKAEQP